MLKAPIPFDAKFPALLPKEHKFPEQYIQFLHRKHLHTGPKALIGILRQKIWIINARQLVRKVIKGCIHCYHYKPKLQQQIMANLPADRLKAQRLKKLAVFVCFTSKAVHFQIVSDLSTSNFLLCLKRFTGRRGMPIKIYCDNATNFVGARSMLKDFQQCLFNQVAKEDSFSYSTQCGFEFCFIPEHRILAVFGKLLLSLQNRFLSKMLVKVTSAWKNCKPLR